MRKKDLFHFPVEFHAKLFPALVAILDIYD